MKKAVFNKTGMKQLINSGWKLFDKQTNCITTGNAYCNTQMSSCIRPWSRTECNGFENPKGHLLDFDLSPFTKYRMPSSIKDILTDQNRESTVILYMFFVYKEHIEPFLWAVTTLDYKLIRSQIVCGYRQNFEKRHLAEKEVLNYITK